MTLNTVKGFLDNTEGEELAKIAKQCSKLGPCLEIGTYCGKSALIMGSVCKKNKNILFTIDHHTGSEEHQLERNTMILTFDQTLRASIVLNF